MVRVRFPNGQCLQYNNGTYLQRHPDGHTDIRTKEGGPLIAQAPTGAVVIEFVEPCAITNPIAREVTPESALDLVTKHLRTLPDYRVRALKAALRNFNAKTRGWRKP